MSLFALSHHFRSRISVLFTSKRSHSLSIPLNIISLNIIQTKSKLWMQPLANLAGFDCSCSSKTIDDNLFNDLLTRHIQMLQCRPTGTSFIISKYDRPVWDRTTYRLVQKHFQLPDFLRSTVTFKAQYLFGLSSRFSQVGIFAEGRFQNF